MSENGSQVLLQCHCSSSENVTASYSDGQTDVRVTYLRNLVSCLLAARAHVVLLAAGRWMLTGSALLQNEDTCVFKHLCSLLIARGPPVNGL
jgi:hypothetical protein